MQTKPPEPFQTPEQEADAKSKAFAADDLGLIESLLKSDGYKRYYLRRLNEKTANAHDKILDLNTNNEDLLRARIELRILQEIVKMPVEEAVGCRSTLGLGKDEVPN